MATLTFPRRCAQLLSNLGRDTSAVAMVEFAFAAPIVLSMGLLGVETANLAVTHMKVSQLAMQVADNASRVGDTEVLTARRVFEDDINETLVGGERLGESLDIFENGRVIISSLQQNPDGGQWIAWQRCRGAKNHPSSFGVEGDGASGFGFLGMGESANRITASPGTAVMFVEVSYTYDPISPLEFFGDTQINYTAAFNIRDNRDLSQIHQTTPASPVANCAVFSSDRPS